MSLCFPLWESLSLYLPLQVPILAGRSCPALSSSVLPTGTRRSELSPEWVLAGTVQRTVPSRGLRSPGGSAQGQPGGGNFTPSLLVLADVEELWIGLNDLKLQMNFEWSDGTPVRFTYWHPFEPNNFRDSLEDCVTIWGPVRACRGWGAILHLCKEHRSILIDEEGIP